MKAALIGLGPHGKRVLSVLRDTPGIELAAVVDRRKDALERSELASGIGQFESSSAMFDALTPDLVCIATNGPSHAPIAIEAMSRGAKRLIVEKPMACSLEECDRMLQMADELKVRLAVVSRRTHPLYVWLAENFRAGTWGKLRSIFLQQPGIGLGCLGVHAFDQIAQLAGTEIERVTGWVDPPQGLNPRGNEFVDPGGTVVMELGGVRAILQQIEGGSGPMAMEVDLEGARIQVDESIRIRACDPSVKPGPDRPRIYQDVEAPAELAPKPSPMSVLRGVVDDVLSDGPIRCSAEAGRDAVEVLIAAHLSHQRGNIPVKLPLTTPEERGVWLPVT